MEKQAIAKREKKTASKEEKPAKEKKVSKKSSKEEVPATPVKTPVTEAKATAYNIRVTPRKVRLVIDLVRGKNVAEALGILKNVNKSASDPVIKVIKSAAANAINNFQMDESRLYIASIYANDGLRIKRFLPRAKGSASGLVKRSAHITCVVKMR